MSGPTSPLRTLVVRKPRTVLSTRSKSFTRFHKDCCKQRLHKPLSFSLFHNISTVESACHCGQSARQQRQAAPFPLALHFNIYKYSRRCTVDHLLLVRETNWHVHYEALRKRKSFSLSIELVGLRCFRCFPCFVLVLLSLFCREFFSHISPYIMSGFFSLHYNSTCKSYIFHREPSSIFFVSIISFISILLSIHFHFLKINSINSRIFQFTKKLEINFQPTIDRAERENLRIEALRHAPDNVVVFKESFFVKILFSGDDVNSF